MRMQGGYAPKISGRPGSTLKKVPLASFLIIDLKRQGSRYSPIVKEGQKVKIGDALAEAGIEASDQEGQVHKQTLIMPSPADGTVHLTAHPETGEIVSIKLTDIGTSGDANPMTVKDPTRLASPEAREILIKNGIWEYFWSSKTGGIPETEGKPKAIIINTVVAEPFRTRGSVILKNFWHSIINGMSYLPLLLADYGTIEFILTQKNDPIVQAMLKELHGKAWVKFHFVDLKYPVENPLILNKLVKDEKQNFTNEDDMWIVNIQAIEAVGACLGKGLPLSRRIVAMSGPALPDPTHIDVRIGTPLKDIIPKEVDLSSTLVLRGGLFIGTPVDPETDSVGFDDDAFFFLPIKEHRDFVSFVRPGMDKRSIFPNFTGRIDRGLSNQLRGELRPCIACGKCQEICPVDLIPQIIHRYLYADNIDNAQKMGLDICIDCNLCTFVCPSKIELGVEFAEARETLRKEQEGNS
ncbi:MAG: 4Fe-4S dicluster domain-containing protein [Spirochaetales bacterium]|nr:4Fe-4S dicluster domain-containing protein [Spirochaetales bacterium]